MADDEDRLYGLPLEEFTAARDVLAKELRARGDREEADRIRKLPKPRVGAWAVNQVARTQRRPLRRLFEAGDAMREATRALLGGHGDREGLRASEAGVRSALDELVDAARGLLTGGGHDLSATTIDRVRETLRAAALDEGAREDVEAGRLTRELSYAGLGQGLGAAGAVEPKPAKDKRTAEPEVPEAREAPAEPKAPAKGKPAAKRERAAEDAKADAARERAAEARKAEAARERREARERERQEAQERKRREAALRRARQREERAQKTAETAAERLAAAERALDKAREAAEAARAELDQAAAERDAAEREGG
jgi:hypothetical protein